MAVKNPCNAFKCLTRAKKTLKRETLSHFLDPSNDLRLLCIRNKDKYYE